MRIFACLAFLAFAACGNEDSVSLTSDGGTGGGGLDGSMNDRDMAVPPPDMATPRDMAVVPDTAVPDMDPTWTCLPTPVSDVGATVPLHFDQFNDLAIADEPIGTIVDAKLVFFGDDERRTAVMFVTEYESEKRVFLTTYDFAACAWRTPELLWSATDIDRLRTDVAQGATNEVFALSIEYEVDGVSHVDATLIDTAPSSGELWSFLDPATPWADVTAPGGGAVSAPVVTLEADRTVIAYVQSRTCSGGGGADTDCPAVVLAQIGYEKDGEPTFTVLPLPNGYAARAVRPSVAFDERGKLAVAAFFEATDPMLPKSQAFFWREAWDPSASPHLDNGWEPLFGPANAAVFDSAMRPALSLAFHDGVFSLALRDTVTVTDYRTDPETLVSTPGVFLYRRDVRYQGGLQTWDWEGPFVDSENDVGDALELRIEPASGRKLVVVGSGSGLARIYERRAEPDDGGYRPFVPNGWTPPSEYTPAEGSAHPLHAALGMSGLTYALFTDATDVWLHVNRPDVSAAPTNPCALREDERTYAAHFDSGSSKLEWTKLLLDAQGEPLLVFATSAEATDALEPSSVTIYATKFTLSDPEVDTCWWWSQALKLDHVELDAVYLPPGTVGSRIDAQFDTRGTADPLDDRIVVVRAKFAANSYDDGTDTLYVLTAPASFDAAYVEKHEISLVDDAAAPLAISSVSLSVAENRFRVAARARGCSNECDLPVVVSSTLDALSSDTPLVGESVWADAPGIYRELLPNTPVRWVPGDERRLSWRQAQYEPSYEEAFVIASEGPSGTWSVDLPITSATSGSTSSFALVTFEDGTSAIVTSGWSESEGTNVTALYTYAGGLLSAPMSLDVPQYFGRLDLVGSDLASLTVVGDYAGYSDSAEYQGAGPFVVPSAASMPAGALVRPDQNGIDDCDGYDTYGEMFSARGTNFSALYDDAVGTLVAYELPSLSLTPSDGCSAIQGGLYVWRQR